MTHGDIIRAMDDEGLATLVTTMLSEREKIILKELHDKGIKASLVEDLHGSYLMQLEWLREEAEREPQ